MKKRVIAIIAAVLMTALVLAGCAKTSSEGDARADERGKIKVVTTIFPPYDFVRAVGGDHVEVEMLLSPGAEVHSFEPTPQNIVDIGNCDLFVYVGGEGDTWVEGVLDSFDHEVRALTLEECVTLLNEEIVEGMEAHEHDHEADEEHSEEEEHGEGEEEIEYDEHVWTSPENAIRITEKVRDVLSEIDPDHAEAYSANCGAYAEQLTLLDEEYSELVANAARTCMLFADRFPARYFAAAYGLTYYAAFPGCSSDTEASAATVSYLIQKVQEEGIPAVFYIEFSNQRLADAICEATGCKKLLFHSGHNVTREEFEQGITYAAILTNNLRNLREALS